MKFECGKRKRLREEAAALRLEANKQWHSWFAWHRVKVGHEDCRWLETVQRRKVKAMYYCLYFAELEFPVWEWEYRALPLT